MKVFGLSLSLLAAVSLASCQKETGPLIDFSTPQAAADTTYTAAPETATPRHLLIEEFTGVTCTNCPAGHDVIRNLITANPGRVSAIGYQIFDFPQANPSRETRVDNRSREATDLGTSIFTSVTLMPSAAFDRVPDANNTMLLVRPYWAGTAAARLATPSPVNLTITSTYDSSAREVAATVRVAYTGAVSGKQKLSLAITEGSIIDAQEFPGNNVVVADYNHEHVFRDFVTNITGDAVLDSLPVKDAGRVYERRFKFRIDEKWNPDHCSMIAFVHQDEGGSKEVLQSVEKQVK